LKNWKKNWKANHEKIIQRQRIHLTHKTTGRRQTNQQKTSQKTKRTSSKNATQKTKKISHTDLINRQVLKRYKYRSINNSSTSKQELLTLREPLGSTPVFFMRSVWLIFLVFCVAFFDEVRLVFCDVFCWFVCLRPVVLCVKCKIKMSVCK
jgi:lipopolysaccharide export LptBFGC system permease protein LptF